MTFIEFLQRFLAEQRWKKGRIAEELCIKPSGVTERMHPDGKQKFKVDEVIRLDNCLEANGALFKAYGELPYRDGDPALTQDPPRFHGDEYNVKHPERWEAMIRNYLQVLPNSDPLSSYQQAEEFSATLHYEDRLAKTARRQRELRPIVGLVDLVKAHALMNTLHSSRLEQPVIIATQTLAEYKTDELDVYGTAIQLCSLRMYNDRVGDIDKLARLRDKVAACSPYISSFYYEELAKQYLLSDSSDHTLAVIKAAVEEGKKALLKGGAKLKDPLCQVLKAHQEEIEREL